MLRSIFQILFLISLILSIPVRAQNSELYMPMNFKEAYANKTRAFDGRPGSAFWQNRSDYKINVTLDPQNRQLTGSELITYYNNSPDSLDRLIFHLFPNIYKKGHFREFMIDPADAGAGVTISSLAIDGNDIDLSVTNPSATYLHNDLQVMLSEKLHPADSMQIEIKWHYTINARSHMRTGQVDSSSFFVAYFFPRIAVYDDIDGWNDFRYDGIAEFYNDFGNFDVTIEVPQSFIVWASGLLQNADQVLAEKYYQRYQKALNSDQIIHIIDSSGSNNINITAENAMNQWKFKAENVTDFAFATSDHYLWDASSLIVDNSGRRVLIEAAYDKNSQDFYQVSAIARQTIDYLSNEFPAVPFPFPAMTVFNGLDEMEYPMMVNDMSVNDQSYLIKLTSHEITHSYLPFYLGCNEAKYAWMDEGWTSFIDYHICSALDSPDKARIYHMSTLIDNMGKDLDIPMFAISKYLKRPVYHFNSYSKPACFLFVLQDLLGENLFKKCFQIFIEEWNGKHPTPYDFFYSFNRSSGQNLNWLYKSWFFKYGTVDLLIKEVKQQKGKYLIIIEKAGEYPVPVHLNIHYENGELKQIQKNAAVWKENRNLFTIQIDAQANIQKLILSHPVIPDAIPGNNIYLFKQEK